MDSKITAAIDELVEAAKLRGWAVRGGASVEQKAKTNTRLTEKRAALEAAIEEALSGKETDDGRL